MGVSIVKDVAEAKNPLSEAVRREREEDWSWNTRDVEYAIERQLWKLWGDLFSAFNCPPLIGQILISEGFLRPRSGAGTKRKGPASFLRLGPLPLWKSV
jgi:hypothetical protein